MTDFAPLLTPTDSLGAELPIDAALSAVRHHMNMPVAYLSMFDGNDIVCRGISRDGRGPGLAVGDRRLAAGSLCAAIRDGALPQLVTDLSLYTDRVISSLGGPDFAAYIAIPIILPGGQASGTFCCLSPTPVPGLNARDHAVVQSFAARVGQVMSERLDLETEQSALRRQISDIITDRDFQMLFQPIVDLATNSVTGAEALCRFRPTPYRSPDAWFAEADKVGLKHELERTVLKKALEALPDLPTQLSLSVNISPTALAQGDLVPLVDGPFSNRIVLELTSVIGCEDMPGLQKAIRALRDLGVRISVDEIAADRASLRSVMQMKPDIMKLDRDLVRGVHLDATHQALTAAVVHFAEAIGATLIAGGIERAADAEALRELGVVQGQGYLLGRPGGLQALQARIFSP